MEDPNAQIRRDNIEGVGVCHGRPGYAAGQAFGKDPSLEPSHPLYNVHELVMERRVGSLTICLVASYSELC
jgi:hypothetical protein